MYHKLSKENNLIPAGFLQCHFWMLPVIENLTQSQLIQYEDSHPPSVFPFPSLCVSVPPPPVPVLSVHLWFCIQS